MEGVNILDVGPSDIEKPDLVVTDVSFVSIKKIIPHLSNFIDEEGQIVCLIKPQFEVGKKRIKNGVVTDSKTHIEVLTDVCGFIESAGLYIYGLTVSPIKGGDGNSEFLALAGKDKSKKTGYDISAVVCDAHVGFGGR